MNEEIRCITNEEEMALNEWEDDESDVFRALFSVYIKIRAIFSHTLLAIHRSVTSCKYFKKLIIDV